MWFIIDRMLMELTKWNKIRKIEQYMNQNIQATLMIFLSQWKTFMKNSIPNRQPPKLPLLKFLAKFLTERYLKWTSLPL